MCHSLSRHKVSWTTDPASDWWAGPLLCHGNVKKFCSDLKKPWLDLENRNSLSHSQDALKVYSFLQLLEWPTLGSYSDSSETHIILDDISRHNHQSRPGIQHSRSPHHTHQAVCEPSQHVRLLLIRVRYSWHSSTQLCGILVSISLLDKSAFLDSHCPVFRVGICLQVLVWFIIPVTAVTQLPLYWIHFRISNT